MGKNGKAMTCKVLANQTLLLLLRVNKSVYPAKIQYGPTTMLRLAGGKGGHK